MEILARLVRNDEVIEEVPLGYAGEPSTYEGSLPLAAAGSFTLEVLALEPATANFGRVRQELTVGR